MAHTVFNIHVNKTLEGKLKPEQPLARSKKYGAEPPDIHDHALCDELLRMLSGDHVPSPLWCGQPALGSATVVETFQNRIMSPSQR